MSQLRETTYAHEIIRDLFLGSMDAFMQELGLLSSEFGVKAVIRCLPKISQSSEEEQREQERISKRLADAGVPPSSLRVIPLYDDEDEDMFPHLEEAVKFIQQNIEQKKVGTLVHCQAGVSRSASVVAAYLVQKNKIDVESALDLIRARRYQVCPNEGFLRNLKEFQQVQLGSKSVLNESVINRWSYRYPRVPFRRLRLAWEDSLRLLAEEEKEEKARRESAAAGGGDDDKKAQEEQGMVPSPIGGLPLSAESKRRMAREKIFQRLLSNDMTKKEVGEEQFS